MAMQRPEGGASGLRGETRGEKNCGETRRRRWVGGRSWSPGLELKLTLLTSSAARRCNCCESEDRDQEVSVAGEAMW